MKVDHRSTMAPKVEKKPADKLKMRWEPFKKVSQQELLLFTRQLLTMLNSGINLIYAFETITNQVESDYFKVILRKVLTRITTGFTLSKALAEHPATFNQIYVGLVRTGEAYGDLPVALENLEHFLEREVNIKSRISQASTYPVFALAVCLCFALFTFKFILPHFVDFFKDLNVPLPLPTKVVMLITQIINKPVTLVMTILGMTGFVFLMKKYYKTPRGRLHIDALKLEVPYLGEVARKIAIARLCNSLSALIDGGVDVRRAMELSGKASGNCVYEDSMKMACVNLTEGSSLSAFFQTQKKLFGDVFHCMIRVGEESGDVGPMFKKISQLYEQDVENALESLSVIIEPMLILVTGSIIGFIIIAVFLPLYGIMQKL